MADFEYKWHGGVLFDGCPGKANGRSRDGSLSKDRRYQSESLNLAALSLEYGKKELTSYTEFRLAGISKASFPWMKRCSLTFWNVTKGKISKETCDSHALIYQHDTLTLMLRGKY